MLSLLTASWSAVVLSSSCPVIWKAASPILQSTEVFYCCLPCLPACVSMYQESCFLNTLIGPCDVSNSQWSMPLHFIFTCSRKLSQHDLMAHLPDANFICILISVSLCCFLSTLIWHSCYWKGNEPGILLPCYCIRLFPSEIKSRFNISERLYLKL